MYKNFALRGALILIAASSITFFACNESAAPATKYEWVIFSEDLVCSDRLTNHVQCFRIRLALRMKGEDLGELHSKDRSLPSVFRECILLRIENSSTIPIDFDDAARVDDLRRELSSVVDSVVDSPRVEVGLRSCGERVEDMTEEELGKMFDEMDEETKRKLMDISPILGYVDDE